MVKTTSKVKNNKNRTNLKKKTAVYVEHTFFVLFPAVVLHE